MDLVRVFLACFCIWMKVMGNYLLLQKPTSGISTLGHILGRFKSVSDNIYFLAKLWAWGLNLKLFFAFVAFFPKGKSVADDGQWGAFKAYFLVKSNTVLCKDNSNNEKEQEKNN